jgi:hypothetical protein
MNQVPTADRHSMSFANSLPKAYVVGWKPSDATESLLNPVHPTCPVGDTHSLYWKADDVYMQIPCQALADALQDSLVAEIGRKEAAYTDYARF